MKKAHSFGRRYFLYTLSLGGGLALAGGGLWGRRAYAVGELKRKLTTDYSLELTEKAHREITAIPAKAREEIRTWFHGKCLNVAPFVNEVCSEPFREKLHLCRSEEEQHLMLATFSSKVATDVEITNRVRTIAEEVGQELDTEWGRCWSSIDARLDVHIIDYANPLELNEFLGRAEQVVKDQLAEAVEAARVGNQNPALGETIGKIGESALLLLPMFRIKVGPAGVDYNPGALQFGIPIFAFLAFKNLFQYITGQLTDPRPDLQSSISARVSLIGNRVGSEFETELRSRIAHLHKWQEGAIDQAARHYADTSVGWL